MSRPRATALALAVTLLALAAPAGGQELVYLAFGDSLTAGTGDSKPTPSGYPKRLQKFLRKAGLDVSVENHGVGGETTAEGLSRIVSVLAGGGDCLLLMEGTNDVTLAARGDLSVETVIRNLDEMARKAKARDIRPVHLTFIPRAPDAGSDRSNAISLTVTWALRELAIDKRRELADVWESFSLANDPDVYETLYSDDPDDPVGHPNAEGYDRLARVVADALLGIDNVNPVPGSFEPGLFVRQVPKTTRFQVSVFEPRQATGLDLEETYMTLNGRRVAAPDADSTKNRAAMTFEDPTVMGCRAELGIEARDRSDPPNVLRRVMAIYDVKGRQVFVGDLDFDCRVDGFDLVTMAWAFGARQDDPRYSIRYDLERDGVIDGEDLAKLAGNFGKKSR